MSFVPASRSRVLLDDGHLSCFLSSAGESYSSDVQDVTVLCSTAKEYLATVEDGTADLSGFFDGSVGAIHDQLKGRKANHDPAVYTYAPAGLAVGEPAEMTQLLQVSYSISGSVSGVTEMQMGGQAVGGVDQGVSLADLTARTVTGNGTTYDGGASSASGAVIHVHVTEVSGTTPTLDLKVQHSVDGSTWADLDTVPQQTGAAAVRRTVSGTVNRYLRAIWTVGGTTPEFTFAVALARR